MGKGGVFLLSENSGSASTMLCDSSLVTQTPCELRPRLWAVPWFAFFLGLGRGTTLGATVIKRLRSHHSKNPRIGPRSLLAVFHFTSPKRVRQYFGIASRAHIAFNVRTCLFH